MFSGLFGLGKVEEVGTGQGSEFSVMGAVELSPLRPERAAVVVCGLPEMAPYVGYPQHRKIGTLIEQSHHSI